MKSTMQQVPLTVARLLRHAVTTHPTARVVTATATGTRTSTFADLGVRSARLANALRALGIDGDQRVGTFQWNNTEHLEAYAAIPAMGAVLHTLNIRLSEPQLLFVIGHAEDRVLLVDAALVDRLAPLCAELSTIEHVIVSGSGSEETLRPLEGFHFRVHLYEKLLAEAEASFDWPTVNEDDAAAMCYTSGTTGDPKGVVYSHRSVYLHSMACAMGDAFGITTRDRVMPVVPMFHANAWGLPYAAMLVGADLILPDRFMRPEELVRLIETARPTVTAAVPTIWSDVLGRIRTHGGDLSSLRLLVGGGAPVPVSLQQDMAATTGVLMLQAWGMTETSPVALVGWPPVEESDPRHWGFRAKQGRLLGSIEARVVADDGTELPRDGRSAGEIEVRGPYVTAGYHGIDHSDALHNGWLRTGDIGTIDELGYIALTDRAKDIIKSGGEWISSVELESLVVAHPAVREAAAIGIPDDRWQERPLVMVAFHPGITASCAELREHLSGALAKWQLPDTWAITDTVPKTSVGKYDKKRIRQLYHDGEIIVLRTGRETAADD
ncbi:fatty acid--CoA ligase [Nocardia jinanensis]|uniref:Long-chain-fatty-acid--CoA ligase n=1 Tax=Nocardia jinanensis TaxID=382504 RepID=A0A917VSY9_9NOCA|nr:fatty acid--CoA ligase [Nocardia jinanensis]GGL11505.1 long-chain-fatty-acid--CoA ligase [Nocardia jinanensis]